MYNSSGLPCIILDVCVSYTGPEAEIKINDVIIAYNFIDGRGRIFMTNHLTELIMN